MNALIIVDVQNDFCPGGALPVVGGDAVVPIINSMLPAFDVVVATQDWHPANHASFAANHVGAQVGDILELNGLTQVLWPVHCVQNTPGADFHPLLDTSGLDATFRKGQDPNVDAYSGFFDNGRLYATGLAQYLNERGVGQVIICGLATDYCVRWTALDALSLGFQTYVVADATRGVDLVAGDSERALAEVVATGGKIISSAQVGGQRW